MYGSGKVEVILNGKELDMDEAESCGNVTSAYSPKMQGTRHSIFELSFKASPGRFGTQCRFFRVLSFFCAHTRVASTTLTILLCVALPNVSIMVITYIYIYIYIIYILSPKTKQKAFSSTTQARGLGAT